MTCSSNLCLIHRLTIGTVLIWTAVSMMTSCYSLKGASIGPEIDTFFVERFDLAVASAPATLNLDFTTRLQDVIERESRLRYNETDPDIQFSGAMTRYQVSSEAAGTDNLADFERLTIDVRVNYEDLNEEDNNWEQTFSFYRDFDADQSLVDNEDEYIGDIFDQLTTEIFNRAFSNW